MGFYLEADYIRGSPRVRFRTASILLATCIHRPEIHVSASLNSKYFYLPAIKILRLYVLNRPSHLQILDGPKMARAALRRRAKDRPFAVM